MTQALDVRSFAAAAPDARAQEPSLPAVSRPGPMVELDPATLEACCAGDATAIRSFILRYQDLVFSFLSRTLGRGPHVEDLAQEVFLRACRALPRFSAGGASGPGRARLSTWVLTIASNLAVDARRKRYVLTTELDVELAGAATATPETERERIELGRALERAARALPANQRDVFVLAEFHGLGMAEIASVLGIRENTVKTRLFRARGQLRVLLQGLWDAREEP